MSRLEEIKNEYAKNASFKSWKEMTERDGIDNFDLKAISTKYAEECVKASLDKASESIDEYCDIYNDQLERYPAEEEVRKAINLESNIVLL